MDQGYYLRLTPVREGMFTFPIHFDQEHSCSTP